MHTNEHPPGVNIFPLHIFELEFWFNRRYYANIKTLLRDIVDRHIVSFLARYYYDIHPDLREVWLYDTAVVSIIGSPFLTDDEVIRRADTGDELIGTVWVATGIVSIADSSVQSESLQE